MAPLEQQISELTNESERLARVLEAQKTANIEAEKSLRKNVEEKEKELNSRVIPFTQSLMHSSNLRFCRLWKSKIFAKILNNTQTMTKSSVNSIL